MKKLLVTLIIIINCILISCGKTKQPTEPPTEPANVSRSENSSASAESPSKSTSETSAQQYDSSKDSSKDTSQQINSSEDPSGYTQESKDPSDSEQFYITKISDELFKKMQGATYKKDCTTSRDDLRYIHILHVDFENNTKEGEIVCNKSIAEDLLEIFKELYTTGYQIEKIRLMDEYDADDETSMRDNNTSCFNFRFISHSTKVSKHGLGMAIDINPLYNPYIKVVDGKTIIEPATAGEYVDRTKNFSHKIDEDDLAYKLFTEHGFVWGGSWESVKDYQHFEK